MVGIETIVVVVVAFDFFEENVVDCSQMCLIKTELSDTNFVPFLFSKITYSKTKTPRDNSIILV